MLNYKIASDDLRKMLEQPTYKVEKYEFNRISAFERLNYYGDTATVFDDLADQLGRVPTQREYVDEGTKRAKTWFATGVNADGYKATSIWDKSTGQWNFSYFKWGEELEKSVRARLARAYLSYLVEYTTIVQIKEMYPEMFVASHHYIDIAMGVDIVCIHPRLNKAFYIHITSNTSYSRKMLMSKSSRKSFLMNKNKKKCFYERVFDDAHIHMVFDKEESWITDMINGNPIMKQSYIKEEIEEALASDVDVCKNNVQFMGFHNWLVENQILDTGVRNFFV